MYRHTQLCLFHGNETWPCNVISKVWHLLLSYGGLQTAQDIIQVRTNSTNSGKQIYVTVPGLLLMVFYCTMSGLAGISTGNYVPHVPRYIGWERGGVSGGMGQKWTESRKMKEHNHGTKKRVGRSCNQASALYYSFGWWSSKVFGAKFEKIQK